MHSLFKPIVVVLCLAFALCFLAPHAHADSITKGTINFTVLSGGPTPTASFIFDNTTNTFTTSVNCPECFFWVIWNGALFDFAFPECNCDTGFDTLAALGQSGSWSADGAAGALGEFGFVGFGSTFPILPGVSDRSVSASGTYEVIITSVTTPEPSSAALMLAGLGLVFAMRKRVGQGLSTGPLNGYVEGL